MKIMHINHWWCYMMQMMKNNNKITITDIYLRLLFLQGKKLLLSAYGWIFYNWLESNHHKYQTNGTIRYKSIREILYFI